MAAGDLGELLVPHMPTIRVPRSGDRVYKNECAFSYDSPNSEGGLYVCMNTFLAFGREHVERHFRKTGQSVYMHLKRHIRECNMSVPGSTNLLQKRIVAIKEPPFAFLWQKLAIWAKKLPLPQLLTVYCPNWTRRTQKNMTAKHC